MTGKKKKNNQSEVTQKQWQGKSVQKNGKIHFKLSQVS